MNGEYSHDNIESKSYFEVSPKGIRFGDDKLRIDTPIFDILKYGDKPGFGIGTKLPKSGIILEALINQYMPEFGQRGMQDIGFRISKGF